MRSPVFLNAFLVTTSILCFSGCEDALMASTAMRGVVDGELATADQVGATVALLGGGTCSGTLIAPNVVLTAAHCGLEGWDFDVIAGVVNAETAGNQARYTVAEVFQHPGFNEDAPIEDADGLSRWNDVAVMILDDNVVGVVPTPILPAAQMNSVLSNGTALTLAGYGVTSENGQQSGRLFITQTPFVRKNASELLAGGQNLPDTCYGDSGGPAYVDVAGQRFVVGITSRGALTAAECGDGGIYTLAPAFADFVQSAVDGTVAPTPPGTNAGSCLGRCDEEPLEGESCYCDDDCDFYGDCCDDRVSICIDGNLPTPEPVPTPDAAPPDVAEPDAAPPDVGEPDAAPPDVAEPDAAPPDVAEPDAAPPDVAEPDVGTTTGNEVSTGDDAPEAEPSPAMPARCQGGVDDCRPRARSSLMMQGGCSATSASNHGLLAVFALVLFGSTRGLRRRRALHRTGKTEHAPRDAQRQELACTSSFSIAEARVSNTN